MIKIIVPIVVFLVTLVGIYLLETDKDKKKNTKFFTIRFVLPAVVLSMLSFLILKFKDSQLLSPDPMTTTPYFSSTVE